MILHVHRGLKQSSTVVQLALGAVCLCLPLTAQTTKAPAADCKAGASSAACSPTRNEGTAVPGGTAAPVPPNIAFPFPVEDSKHAGSGNVETPAANPAGLPAMPTGATPDPPASSNRPMKLPPGYSGSSSSDSDDAPGAASSSSRSAADDDVAPTTAAPDAPIKSSALKDLGSRGDTSAARAKLQQTRVADDLKVGGFYMKDGNTQGAYLRFKDALDRAPDDPDTRFNLAEAAWKLNKREEAVSNYQAYLRLDPGGDHDKASRKALSKMGVAGQ
ncbi:MAG: tetratricopeptide repeat protein [Janthinobacterium lividum]